MPREVDLGSSQVIMRVLEVGGTTVEKLNLQNVLEEGAVTDIPIECNEITANELNTTSVTVGTILTADNTTHRVSVGDTVTVDDSARTFSVGDTVSINNSNKSATFNGRSIFNTITFGNYSEESSGGAGLSGTLVGGVLSLDMNSKSWGKIYVNNSTNQTITQVSLSNSSSSFTVQVFIAGQTTLSSGVSGISVPADMTSNLTGTVGIFMELMKFSESSTVLLVSSKKY